MTSKISLFSYVRENIKQRSYLAAVSAAGMFLLLPINLLMTFGRVKQYYDTELSDWAQSNLYRLINGQRNILILLFIILMGILCATSGYSYLHSKVKQDFFHSMPVSRPKWFLISYFGGLVIFIVPYVFFTACTLIIGQIYSVMTTEIFRDCILSLLSGILIFLLIYHTVILAMTLTGRTGTGILAGIVLFFYSDAPLFLYTGLSSIFFDTWSYYSESAVFEQNVLRYLSPSYLFINTLAVKDTTVKIIAALILMLAAILAVSCLLCKKYPAESAENALAFTKTAPAIKFLVAVPLSLGATMCMNSVFTGKSIGSVWWFVNAVLSVLFICFIIEFIYHHDLKMILKGKMTTGLSLAAVLFVIAVFRFDLFGYDRFIPKEEKLKDMSVFNYNFSNYFTYWFQTDRLEALNKKLKSENFGPLYELAKAGIDYGKTGHASPGYVPFGPTAEVPVTICYGLKNGKNIYREYTVEGDALVDALSLLCEDEDYRKALFPVLGLEPEHVQGIILRDMADRYTQLPIDHGRQVRLMEAYLKDVHDVDISELSYDRPMAELSVSYDAPAAEDATARFNDNVPAAESPEPDIINIDQLYIYSSYSRTLELLEEFGYPPCTRILAEEVSSVIYHKPEKFPKDPAVGDSFGPDIKTAYVPDEGEEITDPAKIQELLDRIQPFYAVPGFIGVLSTYGDGFIEVTLKGNNYSNNYYLYEQ